MFRFFIRDVLWLTVVAAISLCWWSDRKMLTRLSKQSAADQKTLRRQSETIESLAFDNLKMEEQVRRRKLLNEAEPGVYFLGPDKSRLYSR